jgi:hypothetical protein
MAFEGGQGIIFSYPVQTIAGYTASSQNFTCTSIAVSKKVSEIDASSLATKTGDFRSYRPAPIRDGDELKIDFIGMCVPMMTATGAITWTIDGSGSNAGFTSNMPTAALCTSCDITASVGELIKGSASFRLTQY